MKTAALIGISNYARQHLLIVGEQMLQGRLRLAAATVVNQHEEAFFCERLRRLGCRVFDHTDGMWKEFSGRVDLCFIPTGIHLHAAMTLQALRAGANVLVEKPLAASLAQAREIMQLERETGRFVAVGFQDLYTDETWAIKQRLVAGELGRIESITFVGLWPRPTSYYTRNEWAGRLHHNGQRVVDSPVNNAYAHFFNLALFWAGDALALPATVQKVECELYRTQQIESFDTCCARIALSTGCEFRCYVTHSCRENRRPQLVIQGSRGTLTWTHEQQYELARADGPREVHPIPGNFETKILMADRVVARLSDATVPHCSTRIASEHLRLVEALHATAPIAQVPAALLEQRDFVTSQWVELPGIEAACTEAARRGCLWSDLPLPWARRASTLVIDSGDAAVRVSATP